MPKMSCLFAPAGPAVLAALRGDPVAAARLHCMSEVPGVRGPGPLAVVLLSGVVEPPWTADPEGWQRAPGLAADALDEHPWLGDELPPPAVMAGWTRIARATHQPLAWWWWWERGDDLYADAAWLMGADADMLAVRVTPLAADVETDRATLYLGARAEPFHEAPLQRALGHLGFESLHQYFVPTDQWRFDWEPFRDRCR